MAFTIEWKPVLQKLHLRDYHPDYGDNAITVCVNPKPGFLSERDELRSEYSRRALEIQEATRKFQTSRQDKDRQEAERLGTEFNAWCKQAFLPGTQDWFARLWSFGDDPWTAADLEQIESTDEHLVIWLKMRSIEMIDNHRTALKKA